jgi:hypothetical protein
VPEKRETTIMTGDRASFTDPQPAYQIDYFRRRIERSFSHCVLGQPQMKLSNDADNVLDGKN